MVATDDEEIAQVALKYGAKVPFLRSNENANDIATLADVIDEVKKAYVEIVQKYEYACCILPTAPLITVQSLITAYHILLEKNVDSVRPLIRFSYPIQRALKMKDGKIEVFYSEYLNTRSQDLVSAYHDAGQFYWMKFESGLRGKNKFGFEISEVQAQDIDSEDDWKLAELKYYLCNDINLQINQKNT